LRVLPEFGCEIPDSVDAGDAGFASVGGQEPPAEVMRRGLNAETLGRQQDNAKGAYRRYRRASAISAYGPAPEFASYLNESEKMTTYLTLVGMLLFVTFPLLIPIAVTMAPLCSNRFGRIANWRKTTTARPLPSVVPVFSDRPGVHPAPSPA
jgi:hypothetical protein